MTKSSTGFRMVCSFGDWAALERSLVLRPHLAMSLPFIESGCPIGQSPLRNDQTKTLELFCVFTVGRKYARDNGVCALCDDVQPFPLATHRWSFLEGKCEWLLLLSSLQFE